MTAFIDHIGARFGRIFGSPRRLSNLTLAIASLVSVATTLYFGRGTTFSYDEISWFATTPGFSLSEGLVPASGHLLLLPRALYALLFETLGTSYLTFKLLSIAALLATVYVTYAYTSRRLHPYLALAPCLTLLFFGPDAFHMFHGNGFTILFALTCGVGSLLALEREDRKGDLLACTLLSLGVITYSVTLPFVLAAVVIVAVRGRRRLWVPAVPIGIYLAWRLWLIVADVYAHRGGIDLKNLLLLPSWSFQSLSAFFSDISGLSYDFGATGLASPSEWAGPLLAFTALGLLIWRLNQRPVGVSLYATLVALIGLFALQVVAWIPGIRLPGADRYMYPVAVVVILVATQACHGFRFNRLTFQVLAVVIAAGISTNVIVMRDEGVRFRAEAMTLKADIRALTIAASADELESDSDPPQLENLPSGEKLAAAEDAYGEISFALDDLTRIPTEARARLDELLPQFYGVELVAASASQASDTTECQDFSPLQGEHVLVNLPPGPITLRGERGADQVALGRFSELPTVSLSPIPPREVLALNLPQDSSEVPWKLSARTEGITICRVK